MSSKLIGADSEFFSKMIVEAAHDIKVSDGKGGHNYPIKVSSNVDGKEKEMIILF